MTRFDRVFENAPDVPCKVHVEDGCQFLDRCRSTNASAGKLGPFFMKLIIKDHISWVRTVFHEKILPTPEILEAETCGIFVAKRLQGEGEDAPHTRIERWSRMIGKAGQKNLSIQSLEDLQRSLIPGDRFVQMGCRVEGGFVGKHKRDSCAKTKADSPNELGARNSLN